MNPENGELSLAAWLEARSTRACAVCGRRSTASWQPRNDPENRPPVDLCDTHHSPKFVGHLRRVRDWSDRHAPGAFERGIPAARQAYQAWWTDKLEKSARSGGRPRMSRMLLKKAARGVHAGSETIKGAAYRHGISPTTLWRYIRIETQASRARCAPKHRTADGPSLDRLLPPPRILDHF